MGDQRCELVRVETVNPGAWHPQLQRMPRRRGEVDVGPVDRLAAGLAGDPAKPDSPQQRLQAELDSNQARFRPALGQQHVADPHDSLPGKVDHLGVKDVGAQQQAIARWMLDGLRQAEVDPPRLDASFGTKRIGDIGPVSDTDHHDLEGRVGAAQGGPEIGNAAKLHAAGHHGRAQQVRQPQHGGQLRDGLRCNAGCSALLRLQAFANI